MFEDAYHAPTGPQRVLLGKADEVEVWELHEDSIAQPHQHGVAEEEVDDGAVSRLDRGQLRLELPTPDLIRHPGNVGRRVAVPDCSRSAIGKLVPLLRELEVLDAVGERLQGHGSGAGAVVQTQDALVVPEVRQSGDIASYGVEPQP